VRFLFRWHIPWSRVPSLRPVGLAIAIVIVGGSLLETGAVARTPKDSADLPAPLAAMTGPGDTDVALAASDPGAPFAREGDAVASHGSPLAVATDAPAGSLALAGTLDSWAASDAASDPQGPAASVRALDPDRPEDLVLLAARTTVTAQASGPAPSARKKANAQPRWRRRAGSWRNSPRVTWYGPGFYGNRTACGQRYTRYIAGVAHRTLPCGTMVQFRWHGRTAVAPVIDRGPYGGRDLVFDWSAWLACRTFRPKRQEHGCFTRADVNYRVVGKVDLDRWFKRRKP